ncbi:methyltransferase, FxLD system [Streptomyces sp. NPDC059928]|uniref:methyltransferase, FxLD system n=1 Tax=unclassified Streptomyces TaxID=2593676 RepID=UPI00366726F0
MTSISTTDMPSDAGPDQLRTALVDQLLAANWIRSPAVEAAFRKVPRHRFAPEAEWADAYANDVVGARKNSEGQATSSVSAPWLQANMLEAARIRPGHRVLEIGSGGYNAALAAELVGDLGTVTTVDIDPVVTDRATHFLAATGYDRVQVVTADGACLPGVVVPDTGFDAVIVTAETADLPWFDLVADGGRLVAPLRIHGYVWSIGFTKHDGVLVSDEPLTSCGFVPMQGAGAWNTARHVVPGTSIRLTFEDGPSLPVDHLAGAFGHAPQQVRTNVTVGGEEPFDDLMLYLAGALPGFCRLAVGPEQENGVLNPPPPHWPGAATVRDTGLARLVTDRIGDDERGKGVYEFVIHGYGPSGRRAATEMAEQVLHWQRNHRAATCPRVTAEPQAAASTTETNGPTHRVDKEHVRLSIDWPIIPGTAALLTNDRGEYLLHLRSANKPIWGPGTWALLGGHTERGESCDEAIARELREETGLTIPGLAPFITRDTLSADGSFRGRVRVYTGTLNTPAHEIPLTEGIQLRWTHPDEMVEMALDPATAAVLRAHQQHPHPRYEDDGTLVTVAVRESAALRDRSIIGAHLVLVRDGKVLLGKRHPDSAFAPDTWHLPAGHRDEGESTLACVVREAGEETGLAVTEKDLRLVHTLDLRDPDSTVSRMGLFFAASQWVGEPRVLEPDRCTEWRWWPLDALPEPLVEYTHVALAAIARGDTYSEMGWR